MEELATREEASINVNVLQGTAVIAVKQVKRCEIRNPKEIPLNQSVLPCNRFYFFFFFKQILMSVSPILAVMEVRVLMGWLPSHVCAFQATLECTARRVSS